MMEKSVDHIPALVHSRELIQGKILHTHTPTTLLPSSPVNHSVADLDPPDPYNFSGSGALQ